MTNIIGFERRFITGWISEYVNRRLTGPWPQIELDDLTMKDLETCFDLCQESGYTDVILWGLFVARNWPVDIVSCVNSERRKRIEFIIDAAHKRGLAVHCGLGLYSWGFETILAEFPHLARGNARTLCASAQESHEWMEKVLDFVLDGFAFDGLDMQSSDQGRCPCPECAVYTDIAYHGQLYQRVARYARLKCPDIYLMVDNWGCPFDKPEALPDLVALSLDVDCLIDFDNSAGSGSAGPGYRKQLIETIHCPYGTLAGTSVWPPIHWDKDRYFVPTTLTNVGYIRNLQKDGARLAVQFVTSTENPSGEISLRFMGELMANPDANPETLLASAVNTVYAPETEAVRDQLVRIVTEAENAYFAHASPQHTPKVGLICVGEGFESLNEPGEPTYLQAMSPSGRLAYAQVLQQCANDFEPLRSALNNTTAADITARCFANALADIQSLENNTK